MSDAIESKIRLMIEDVIADQIDSERKKIILQLECLCRKDVSGFAHKIYRDLIAWLKSGKTYEEYKMDIEVRDGILDDLSQPAT